MMAKERVHIHKIYLWIRCTRCSFAVDGIKRGGAGCKEEEGSIINPKFVQCKIHVITYFVSPISLQLCSDIG